MKRLFNGFVLTMILVVIVNIVAVPAGTVRAAGNLLKADGRMSLQGPTLSPLLSPNTWNALGSGLNGTVYAILVNGTDVYVGGSFTDAGGNANADYIAKWDGSSWSALSTGLNANVSSIVVRGTDLYVGGGFTNAGGDANADYVAMWDGSAWSSMGNGLNSYVNVVAVGGNNVYVGGNFTDAGGVASADYIAKLDGGTWESLGTTPLTNTVNAAIVSGAEVYVGGTFLDVGGILNADSILRWDGTSWNVMGGGISGNVNALALSDGNLYAGGSFNNGSGIAEADKIIKWDGTSWSALGSGLSDTVYTIYASGETVYAGGFFLNAGGNANADYIAKWNGSSWSALGTTPLTASVRSLTVDGLNLYAGGNFLSAGGAVNADRIARFEIDGSAPTVNSFTVASTSTSLNIPIAAFTASDNVAVTGYTITESSTPPAANAAGWGSSAFSTYTVPSSGVYTLYPWAKDATGNVSAVYGSPVSVVVDASAPSVTSFSVPSSSTSLDISITTFTASDNVAVSGYLITQSSTRPSAGAAGWTASAPTTYTVSGDGSYTLYPWVKDAVGNVSSAYGSPATVAVDTIRPAVTAFSAPTTSASLSISITTFNASDNVAVTGFLITEASTPPSAGAAGWTATAPTSFTVGSQGSHTLYPWAKDAAGNVSAVYGSPVTVSVDLTRPTVNTFTVPTSSTSLAVSITAFTASDNIAVSGYQVTESSTAPSAGTAGWTVSAPATYTVANQGSHTLYPWAKDAAGNVSLVYGSPRTVSVDTTAPTVTAFSAPASSNSLQISINSFTASDVVGVTGYLITESSTAPSAGAAGWTASAPTTYTAASQGSHTLYPWAKDAVGRVSAVYGSPVSISVDTEAPVVSTFSVLSTWNTFDIAISDFTASDAVGVTGYLITESSTPPLVSAPDWTGSAPTTYSVTSDGSYTLYPWAKDAAGYVSPIYDSPATVTVDASSTVTNSNDSGSGSLRDILASSAPGDTVTFDPTLSGATIHLASTLVLSKDVTIDGSMLAVNITISGDSDNNGTGDVQIFDIGDLVNVTLKSLILTKGQANEGGAILSRGPLNVIDSVFSENSAATYGGAISNYRALTIVNSTFVSNSAHEAGAILNSYTLDISGSTFSGNSADNNNGAGGALYNAAPATITNSTFSGNAAAIAGGILTTQPLTITNSTLSDNFAILGGGLVIEGYTTNLSNTIIANSTGGDCINNSTIGTNTNNLVEDGSCSAPLSGDPKLGPLQSNGGPTQTMSIGSSSPAMDAGTNVGCPLLDQRGIVRPQGILCDIGAYEVQYAGLVVDVGNTNLGTYNLAPGSSTRQSFVGLNNGPVKIAGTSARPILGAERVVYKVSGINTSFSEIMGLPNSQLDTTYWLPWYNNVDLDTQLRFGNVSNSTATVHVYIGGAEMLGSPFVLEPGASTRQSFAGINGGPVKIESDVPIVAAERVIYKVNQVNTSFSELLALPNSQLDTTYWLPWYNNVDLDTQLRIGNVSGSTATVHIFIGGAEMTPASGIVLLTGESTRVSYIGANNGPVQIVSDVPVVAAERVIYKVNGKNTSFSEMMALSQSQLDTTYWLPWYNNVDLDTQLRFGNVSSSTATVRVYIGGVEMLGSPFTLDPGASKRVSFAGINAGPVKIESNASIVVAERVIYKANGVNTSYSELMALWNGGLDTIYWLPWYNNVGLDTQLRFGVP